MGPRAPGRTTVEIREVAERPDPVRRFRVTRQIGRDGLDLATPVDFAAGQPVVVRLRLPGSDRRLELPGTVGDDREGAPREIVFGDLPPDDRAALVGYVKERLQPPQPE